MSLSNVIMVIVLLEHTVYLHVEDSLELTVFI